jgi:urea carboxylase
MSAIEVLAPGAFTTVQDWPGRTGFWEVGVPPSGPMDGRSATPPLLPGSRSR